MDMLKKCFNPRVLAGLALVALALFMFAPKLAIATLPLLLLGACPLSMILMMRAMGRGRGSSQQQNDVTTLKQRYANGDLTDQEFDRMKQKIQGL